jgi:hypothetical protein
LILVPLCGIARLAKIAVDIGIALRALANAKIHSNATPPSISTVSQGLGIRQPSAHSNTQKHFRRHDRFCPPFLLYPDERMNIALGRK